MPKPVSARNAKRPMPSAPDNRPTPNAGDAADVLARVYALILSWPTADEKRAGQEGSNPT